MCKSRELHSAFLLQKTREIANKRNSSFLSFTPPQHKHITTKHLRSTMSLADDFLADIDYEEVESITSSGQDSSAQQQDIYTSFGGADASSSKRNGGDLMDEDEDDEDGDLDMEADMNEADSALEAMMREVQSAKNARDIARLMDSTEMKGILKVNHHGYKKRNPPLDEVLCFTARLLPFV